MLAQRSTALAGRTGALRGKSAAMTGVIKHAINKAGERPVLTARLIVSFMLSLLEVYSVLESDRQ
jgi:hypothetical protein